MNSTTFESQRPAPALTVSLICESSVSLGSDTTAIPPCARFDDPLSKASFEIKRTSYLEEIWIAAARPAAPVPMINASVECQIVKEKMTVNKKGILSLFPH